MICNMHHQITLIAGLPLLQGLATASAAHFDCHGSAVRVDLPHLDRCVFSSFFAAELWSFGAMTIC